MAHPAALCMGGFFVLAMLIRQPTPAPNNAKAATPLMSDIFLCILIPPNVGFNISMSVAVGVIRKIELLVFTFLPSYAILSKNKIGVRDMDIWQKIQNDDRPVALYGMGNGADRVLEQLRLYGVKPVGVFASSSFVRHQTYQGYTVSDYQSLAERYPDMIILVCFGTNRPEVLSFIETLSERHTVLCPDVPVYGDTVFDIEFARANADKLRFVYERLADEHSRKTFENIVRFKLSGEYKLLRACQYDGALFDPIDLTNEETYVDAGAYRGDTVELFLSGVSSHRKIIALEPNRKTYEKLKERIKKAESIVAVRAAVSDFDGEAEMLSDGRGSSIGQKGESVPVCTLDKLLEGESVSLIKMDVEGQEAAALRGARKIITAQKPKMIMAAYHRSEDIFDLPLAVLNIRSDYKILLRHNPHNLAWDTNYYFI